MNPQFIGRRRRHAATTQLGARRLLGMVAAAASLFAIACGGDPGRDEIRTDPELVGGKADIPSWLSSQQNQLACGKRLSAAMKGYDSAHVYKLAAEKGTVYTFGYDARYTPDRGAVVAVYGPTGRLIQRDRNTSSQAASVSFTADKGGTYHVAVYSVRWYAKGDYKLATTCGVAGLNEVVAGQTKFTTYEQNRFWGWRGPMLETARSASTQSSDAPSGRTAAVEEGDIYKVDGNRLLYFNTYRGLMIFDISDSSSPKLLSRVPVYGYPVEMYVQNNTVYALLRDALKIKRAKDGVLRFERQNVSQIVAIDVRDATRPEVLSTTDIVGQLREGVSRKVGDVIYVVSYRSRYYWYGWRQENKTPEEGAWVYAFNVSNPRQLTKVDELEVFRGGGFSTRDDSGNSSERRTFNKVAISATSNVLMVVENWRKYGYVRGSKYQCGTSRSMQQAVVSLIDISDPSGRIRRHARFETYGELGDQFKQTYKDGIYYGIFARREWSSQDCRGSSHIENTIQSWDVRGAEPKQLSSLSFGKPNETVRGTVFDTARKVAFAITARNIDPLYAIDLSNPAKLSIASEIDGLSGDMNVFRFIGKNQFIIGIGRDNSTECTGFDGPGQNRWRTNVAVSIIDVRNLKKIRLVQRKCIAVDNASWIGSSVNSNRDQAHKMIGMHSDGLVNVLTVPVYYSKKVQNATTPWWWYRQETAVGVLSWDLTKYDPTKSEKEQSVLATHGTVVHENGSVRRSIVFTKAGTVARRKMINLSDTHLSLVDIQNLNAPKTDATIELAPYVAEIYDVNGHVVEQVKSSPWSYGEGVASEFRVRARAGKYADSRVVARFTVSQVERVLPYKNSLVIVRRVAVPGDTQFNTTWEKQAVVYDLANPTRPTLRGTIKLPMAYIQYYRFFCGTVPYWWGNADASGHQNVREGIVFLSSDGYGLTVKRKLTLLDLRSLDAPRVKVLELDGDSNLTFAGITADPTDANSVLVTYKRQGAEKDFDGTKLTAYTYFVQRYTARSGAIAAAGSPVNTPGRLVRALDLFGTRLLLTQDQRFERVDNDDGQAFFRGHPRLHLLTQTRSGGSARLRDSRDFVGLQLRDLVAEGRRLFVGASRAYSSFLPGPVLLGGTRAAAPTTDDAVANGARLFIFDLGNRSFSQQFAENTQASSLDIMGLDRNTLFLNLPGDGVLAVDVTRSSNPTPRSFVRTLGYATHVTFAGDTALVAAGYYGVYQLDTRRGAL